jgi:hypothetical protein
VKSRVCVCRVVGLEYMCFVTQKTEPEIPGPYTAIGGGPFFFGVTPGPSGPVGTKYATMLGFVYSLKKGWSLFSVARGPPRLFLTLCGGSDRAHVGMSRKERTPEKCMYSTTVVRLEALSTVIIDNVVFRSTT